MASQENHVHKQHHIDMQTGEIAPTVLVPEYKENVELFASLVSDARKVAQKREYLSYIGNSDGLEISCTSSGIGTSPTAIGTEELIRIGAKNLIRLGSCQVIQPHIKAGDVIIPIGAVRDERAMEEFIPIDYPAYADFHIVRALIDACQKVGLNYHLGIVRTHDALYLESQWAEGDLKARIQKWVDLEVVALDNESSAMFVTASMQGVRAGALLLCGHLITEGPREFPQEAEMMKRMMMAGIEAARVLHARQLD